MPIIERIQPAYTVFRITPHHSVLNSSSRHFQRSLYELFSVKHKPKRDGFRIVYKPAPDFWWISEFTATSITYYCAMPAEFADAFRIKFRNHEQWRKSTLDLTDWQLETDENTELFALKYKRHDIFSLDMDYTEQATPVRNLLGVSSELNEGERVTLCIRTESMPRAKWKKVADYAWESWDSGGVPHRSGFDPVRMARSITNGVTYLVYEAKSLVEEVIAGVERAFFHGGAAYKKPERPTLPNPERAELLVNGDLSPVTKNKRNMPVFKTSIRYMVTSPDPVKREMLARSVSSAYSIVTEKGRFHDNRLDMVKVNIRPVQALNELKNWRIRELSPLLMSVDEVGKLQQLPTSELQLEFADKLESNQRVEIELPKVFLDDSGLLAGTATDRGETYDIHISTKNPDRLFYGRAFMGMQGMGKDQAIINLIVEAKRKHNIGAVIPDVINEQNGHRGMADALRDHLPPEDLIDIDLSDTSHPVYFGLRSIVQNVKDKRIAADRIAEEIAQFLMSDADDDKFQTMDFLREAAKATFGDLQDIKYMFTSQSFRQRKIKDLENTFDMDTWRDFDAMTDKGGVMSGRQGQIYGPIQRRLGQIINSEFLKPIFCQTPNPAMDLYKWIDEGKVVIFRFPKEDVISRRVIELLMYWIVLNVFLIKVSQDGKTKSVGTFLVLNEPHQYLSPGLIHFMKRMLNEGRKKRLAPVFAFHNFQQFREYPGFVDILKTGINWHIFKNENIRMYEELMPQLSKTFADAQQAFEATKQYQYIACWINDEGAGENPFVVDALPLVGKRYDTMNNARLTKEHSRKFGRPVTEVLAEIKRRERAVRVQEPVAAAPELEGSAEKKRRQKKQTDQSPIDSPAPVSCIVYTMDPPSAVICDVYQALDHVTKGWTLFGYAPDNETAKTLLDDCGKEIARRLGIDPDDHDVGWIQE